MPWCNCESVTISRDGNSDYIGRDRVQQSKLESRYCVDKVRELARPTGSLVVALIQPCHGAIARVLQLRGMTALITQDVIVYSNLSLDLDTV